MGRPPRQPRPRRGIDALLDWIEDAEATHRTWARNAFAAFAVLIALYLLAIHWGWLSAQ